MGDYSDHKQIERIINCSAAKKKLDIITDMFKGKTITEVNFINCIQAIGVRLMLNNELDVMVLLPMLSLDELMEDPEIRAQEKELYYQEYPERRPKPEITATDTAKESSNEDD